MTQFNQNCVGSSRLFSGPKVFWNFVVVVRSFLKFSKKVLEPGGEFYNPPESNKTLYYEYMKLKIIELLLFESTS